MNSIEVIPCGTEVKTTLGIVGIITAICLRYGNLNYEVSFYYEGESKVVWVCEQELIFTVKTKTKIGFK